MKIGITLPQDPSYLEARGGIELISHLRSASSRVEYRRAAIDRAFGRFIAADEGGQTDSEVGGLALIVIQRALLVVEDLGGLLHAFGGREPWRRLRSTTVPQITAAFERALSQTDTVLRETFRLATDEEIRSEGLASDEVAALQAARGQIHERWTAMLGRAAELWTASPVAKATLHGFPVVSGAEVLGPPAAGVIAAAIPHPPKGRFAAALISNSPNRHHVHTSVIPILLDRTTIDRVRRDGLTSADLYGELCDVQATSTFLGVRALVPWFLLEQLDESKTEILERVARDGGPTGD
jgi:hypothetical protein